jgi:hypothetical protein
VFDGPHYMGDGCLEWASRDYPRRSQACENKGLLNRLCFHQATQSENTAMRPVLMLGALALFGLVQPANAQMCGAGQQAQASTPAPGGGMAMMCGGMSQVQDDPMADKPAQKPQASGMCPCCRNMAMMRGGQGGGMNMPGMETPKQQQ